MRILKKLEGIATLPGPVFLTFGFFDGFHVGHRLVLRQLLAHCDEKSARSLVVTFETLPGKGEGLKKHIYPVETKMRVLAQMGIDYCLMLNFSEVRKMNYRYFLDFFFVNRVAGMVASHKLCFGYRREGTPERVKKYFSEKGSRAYFLPSVKARKKIMGDGMSEKVGGRLEVSSTDIRRLLTSGNIYQANRKLRLPFHLTGSVMRGKAWGRKIGFPTINFPYPEESIEIPAGSYITVTAMQGKIYPSMTYIGVPLGNQGNKPVVETYLLNFLKSVYHVKVMVYFIKNLEEDKPVKDLESLQILLNRLRNRLERYVEKKSDFFQEKIKWIEEIIKV